MKTVCMIGEGAWGTAVATLLAHNGYTVKLWCHDAHVVDTIKKTRCNERYLPGITLDEKIKPTADLNEAICDVQYIFEAIPIKYLRSVLQQAKPCFSPDQIWVILSKGIEQDTLLLPTQMLDDVFGVDVQKAVFAGPSFAHDVASKQVTAVTIGTSDCAFGETLQKFLANDYFRPYFSEDMIGVQVGSAFKNVITLGIGLLDGAGYTDNPKAFLFTRGLYEIVQLAQAMGGRQETVYGLSGIGDLVLTAMGKLSKNLEVGKRLGVGQSLDAILGQTGYIPEGINAVKSIDQLIAKYKLQLPICQGIYDVIFEGESLEAMLRKLMAQPLEWECTM